MKHHQKRHYQGRRQRGLVVHVGLESLCMKRTVACAITFLKDQNERSLPGYRGGHRPEAARGQHHHANPEKKKLAHWAWDQEHRKRQTLENLCFASEHRWDHKLLRSGDEQGICQDLWGHPEAEGTELGMSSEGDITFVDLRAQVHRFTAFR